ncbi:MAG TPA: glutathione S-transferase family protein [Burkholderiaceae bacterium]
MKFYYNPLSTYSQKAMIALYEKDISVQREVVWMNDAESRAAYEKIYPICKVPLLIADDGRMVPESSIVVEYLENHFPQGLKLIPDDPVAARLVRFNDRMADQYVNEPALKILFDKVKIRNILPEDIERAHKFLAISYDGFNRKLEAGPWVCGQDFTMADCALIPSLYYLEDLVPFAEYKNLAAYWERAKQRPSYRRVMEEFVPVWQGMTSAKAA